MGMRMKFIYASELLMVMQAIALSLCSAYQYKVGDLDAWGIPTSANPDVYTKWSKNYIFRVGDSLLFLYPPSQDSVIQVTPQAYKECHLKDPILYMNDGNSVFNISQPGEYYFTSGEAGHCQKAQKLRISIPGDGTIAFAYPPSYGPTAAPSGYHNLFGSIPTPNAASALTISSFLASCLGLALLDLPSSLPL
ncbi:hypothetical protein Cgig2_000847 [Carnegiea gigantea]|uniref:Phytocyanin domain-containing protein n=1 Tax=Carnegiea gigantea TaxID=171969 RepID=A0A9Q1JKW5_9CARY|nr:hypothetical protein Cgig2_000847 [Carnegiea gigantea]